jgi:LmbE family N-acetylglucosaminyl deacetylase
VKLSQAGADVYLPAGGTLEAALERTTLLGVAAHQDDLECMALYPILKGFSAPGEAFSGVVVTNGAGSSRTGPYKNHTDAEMAAVRRSEQRKAALLGGYALQLQLDHPSSAVKDPKADTAIDDLEAIVRAARPREIYTHNLADKHDTHVGVALKLVAALRRLPPAQRPRRLVGCEVWRGLDWLNDGDKVVMDVDGHEDLSDALMAVFDSQIAGGKRYDLAARGRRKANATFFESHAADTHENLIFGMDLTPLLLDDGLSPQALCGRYLASFRAEVLGRLDQLTGGGPA